MGFIAINDIQISGSTEVSVQITGITSGTTTLTDNDSRLVTEKAIKTYVDNQAGSGTLAGLTDVTITDPSNNEVLVYTGNTWVNSGATLSLSDLSPGQGLSGSVYDGTDPQTFAVDIASFTNELTTGLVSTDELAINDNGTSKRMDVSVIQTYMQDNLSFSTSSALSGLTDTNITSETQGQLLTYDSDSSKWVNSDTITGNITIVGDLYVSGTTVTIDVADMNVADNIILINSGETGAGVTLTNAGIEVDRGTETNYRFIFNETHDTFRVGEIGSEQSVATRQDTPTDTGVAFWDTATSKFNTSTNIVFDGTDLYIPAMKNGSTSSIVYYTTADGKLTYGDVPTEYINRSNIINHQPINCSKRNIRTSINHSNRSCYE